MALQAWGATNERRIPNSRLTAALAAPASAGLTPEELKIAEANFKQANVSGTGKLTTAEFKTFIDLNAAAGFSKAAKVKSFNAYGRAFSGADADSDGTVTWDEYVAGQSK